MGPCPGHPSLSEQKTIFVNYNYILCLLHRFKKNHYLVISITKRYQGEKERQEGISTIIFIQRKGDLSQAIKEW